MRCQKIFKRERFREDVCLDFQRLIPRLIQPPTQPTDDGFLQPYVYTQTNHETLRVPTIPTQHIRISKKNIDPNYTRYFAHDAESAELILKKKKNNSSI